MSHYITKPKEQCDYYYMQQGQCHNLEGYTKQNNVSPQQINRH